MKINNFSPPARSIYILITAHISCCSFCKYSMFDLNNWSLELTIGSMRAWMSHWYKPYLMSIVIYKYYYWNKIALNICKAVKLLLYDRGGGGRGGWDLLIIKYNKIIKKSFGMKAPVCICTWVCLLCIVCSTVVIPCQPIYYQIYVCPERNSF